MFSLSCSQGKFFAILTTLTILISPKAVAQNIIPAPDGTGTIVTPDGNILNINGGTLSRDGANLFHSFQQFGISPQQIANFLSNPQIRNILSRVVGGNPSLINGTLRVSGSNANLYLLNPAGFVFGSNARLDVSGSFTVTTAERIGFGEGAWFNSVGENNFTNLLGSPTSFAFTQSEGGSIINAGDLAVDFGQDLNLIGDTVINTGNLAAPGGNITIAAVPGENLLRISQAGMVLSLEVPPEALVNGITPANLADLLTDPSNATSDYGLQVEVRADGSLWLTGTDVEVNPGDVAIAGGVAAEEVNLAAANRVKPSGEAIILTGEGNYSAPTVTIFPQDATDPNAYVFLDATVGDYESLLYGGKPGTTTVVVTPEEDGISVISKQLSVISEAGSQVDEVHVVSEGGEGNFWLGKSFVNSDNLSQRSSEISAWSGSLAVGADILIYACLAAVGEAGDALLSGLAALTEVDVAGSTNLTGATALGGDWQLEKQVGNVEAVNPFQSSVVEGYDGTLQVFTVQNNNDAGVGSLREAIGSANGNLTGDDIRFNPSFFDGSQDVIRLTSGELLITAAENLTIDGAFGGAANVVVDGNNASRVFNITGSGAVTFESLTIQNGNVSGSGINSTGGGIRNIGDGNLTINDSIISRNFANQGGGISNIGDGNLTINNSVISGNSAKVDGGGIHNRSSYQNDGSNDVSIEVNNSTISGNFANRDGGGIFNRSFSNNGSVKVNNSTISGNFANEDSGGISNSSVSGNAFIEVNNSTISNNSSERIVGGVSNSSFSGNAFIEVNNSTISGNSTRGNGGGIFNISYSGNTSVEINSSTISNNYAIIANPSSLMNASGGGIYNVTSGNASVRINDSTISGNISSFSGGGIRNNSRAENASVEINNSVISDNSAIEIGGGGISDFGSENAFVEVNNSIISGNSAKEDGGGIHNFSSVAASSIINSSIIANNVSNGDGGAISNTSNFGNAYSEIMNSTISGNSAKGKGGGIYNVSTLTGNSIITNSTITNNSANEGGSIYNIGNGNFTITNSITAGNTSTSGQSDDIAGNNFNTGGNNIIGTLNGKGTGTLGTGSDRTFADLGINDISEILAPLADNGGPTQTHALLPNSPAINGGNNNTIPTNITTDQRGANRIANGTVDIGAYEANLALSIVNGNNQVTPAGVAFANPLQVQLQETFSNTPLSGAEITFIIPGDTTTVTATTDTNGIATINLPANNLVGSYQVTATANDIVNTTFNLTNTSPILCPPDCSEPDNQNPEAIPPELDPGNTNPQENAVAINLEKGVEELFTSEFTTNLDLEERETVTLEDARRELAKIKQQTGVTPALIYAFFAPAEIPQTTTNNQELNLLWQFNAQGLARNAALGSKVQGNRFTQADDQLEIRLVTAKGDVIRYRIEEATRAEFEKVATAFRDLISDGTKTRDNSYLTYAKQLYEWLITPLEGDLQARGVDNAIFLLDVGLRSLPLAALHDGQKFLVEKYSIGLMPSLSLTDTHYESVKQFEVLAMGTKDFSQIQALEDLPLVPLELTTITERLWPGNYFLDQEFTPANLKFQRNNQFYGIVHLATHGNFESGKPADSYIQFWDEKVTLDKLPNLNLEQPLVELLVLSACRTALGDREAELGFAGLAAKTGVKSALASLWYVRGLGTLPLMAEFYQQLNQTPIKAEALRQAQIAMLQGKITYSQETEEFILPNERIPLPEEEEEKRALLRRIGNPNPQHPYYWAAFTLIGSPW